MSSIFYVESGKGYPVIFLHGFCETHGLWDEFREKFSENYRVICPDLPGFGKSTLPESAVSINGIAVNLIEWLKNLGINHCIVVGHSLGGYITLAMQRAEPNLMNGFCLFNSTAFEDSEEKKNNRTKLIDFIEREGVIAFIPTFIPSLFHPERIEEFALVMKRLRAEALQTGPQSVQKYAAAMRDRPDSYELLKNASHKALLISGENDMSVTLEAAKKMSEILPAGRAHILPNTAHMAMFEQKETSIEILENFFREISES
ncbi:MAG: alpha/beta hydrolase [Cyclobacteriaceae bacterium]|nr:alpha/beta hydrolase [Cyclobacteriaceae bacterium]